MSLSLSKLKGFTLIELLVVIAVIGGLAGMFLLNFSSAQEKARDAQRQSDVKQLQTALETYATSNSNQFYVGSGSFNSLCSGIALTACPTAPNGAPGYEYRSETTDYVIWAELEQLDVDGNTQYFVTCSTGQSGATLVEPVISSTNCTL